MESSSKRIAKNTLLLYFRQLLTMGVSLFTVRIVLETLGVEDYGVYNVVGGVVTMFSFLSSTMGSASQRFFSFELGKKNFAQLKKTFSMTMNIYLLIGVLIFILAETIGLWFLKTKLNIPADREVAAFWVYQFSILSFMMTMFTVPYNAAIIAHERMRVFAYFSIIEVVLKLIIVYLLTFFSFDKLILYSILTFIVTTLNTYFYRFYCKKYFNECSYSLFWDKELFKKITSYSGWNLFGALATIFNNQGVNIILNLFFGPIVNTARAIAYRIHAAILQFVLNFMTASRPQIIKYYAEGDRANMFKLVFQSSKMSYLLLFVISMPFLLETNFILSVWLKDVPEYVVMFSRLIIIGALIESLSYPLMTAAQATGKIKVYQIVVGGVMLLTLPVGYYLFSKGYPPQSVLYVSIVNSLICLILRLLILRNMINIPLSKYAVNVITPLILTSIAAYAIPFYMIDSFEQGFARFFIIVLCGVSTCLLSILIFALDKSDRGYLIDFIKTFKNRKHAKSNTEKSIT